MRLESAGLAGELCKNAGPSQQLRLKIRSREGRGESGAYCGLLMKVPPLGNHTQEQERLQSHDEDSDFSEPEMHAISSALELENIVRARARGASCFCGGAGGWEAVCWQSLCTVRISCAFCGG